MRSLRAVTIAALLAVCQASAQKIETTAPILPDDAARAIEATPCPKAGQLSVEQCLLWLRLNPGLGGGDPRGLPRGAPPNHPGLSPAPLTAGQDAPPDGAKSH